MKTFPEELDRVEADVVEALLAVLPEGWSSIQLDVDAAFSMQISSDSEPARPLEPPADLTRAVRRHHELCAAQKQPWQSARFAAQLDESFDDWGYTVDYAD